MNNDGKKKRNVGLFCFLAFIALIAIGGVAVYLHGSFSRPAGYSYVFDGWVYGREDQKKASAALATANLDEYTWVSGKLSVPTGQMGIYQSKLAAVGAYPQAPSESRGNALREMSAFESDAKSKMRELDACALQLERTIEQMRGVEYATVGVRSRREQVGLTAKNIVTASVGVACKESFNLDSNALVAITMATKRQLGIDDDSNVSILDLREGKSYLGSEKADNFDPNFDGGLTTERERVEKYWRNKYLEAFADVKNIRVSVEANLIASDNVGDNDASKQNSGATDEKSDDGRVKGVNYLSRKTGSQTSQTSSRSTVSRSRLQKQNSRNRENGFAQLGNPAGLRNSAKIAQDDAQNERNAAALDSARPNVLQEVLRDAIAVDDLKNQSALEGRRGCFSGRRADCSPHLVTAAMSVSDSNDTSDDRAIGLRDLSKPSGEQTHIRQTLAIERDSAAEATPSGRSKVQLQSIVVHICVPRSFIVSAARQAATNAAKETFASASDGALLYSVTEERIFNETKQYAVSLFKPTSDKLGWSDDELEKSFIVDSYSDVDSFGEDNLSSNPPEKTSSAHFGTFGSANDKTGEGINEAVNETLGNDAGDEWLPGNVDPSDSSAKSSAALGNSLTDRGARADTSGKITEIATSSDDAEESETQTENMPETKENAPVAFDFHELLNKEFWQRRDVDLGLLGTLIVFSIIVAICRKSRNARTNKKTVAPETGENSQNSAASNVPADPVVKRAQTPTNYDSYFEGLDEDDLDDELDLEIRRRASQKESTRGTDERNSNEDASSDYSKMRKEALDLISRYPERAAASLQSWVTDSDA